MKRKLDIQKDIILEVFSKVLHTNVAVFNGFDGENFDSDLSIYVKQKGSQISDERLQEYTPDYTLIKTSENSFQYGILREVSPQTYMEPADYDFVFSLSYPSLNKAFNGLVNEIIEEQIGSIQEYHFLQSIETE